MYPKSVFRVFTVAILFLLVGCSTYNDRTREMRMHWDIGNVSSASESAIAQEKNAPEKDKLLLRLEKGATLRGSGKVQDSIKAFDEAQILIEKYDAEPELNLTASVAAILADQTVLDYKGYGYDKIMLDVYQALNRMETRDFDSAAVNLKRAENHIAYLERRKAERIKKESQAIREAQKNQGAMAGAKGLASAEVVAELKKVYGENYKGDISTQQAKGLYANPFFYWVAGVYYMNKAVDIADKNKAADMFRIGGEVLGNKSVVLAKDFAMAEDFANGKTNLTPMTYVVYETGTAPIREQFKVSLPIYIAARNMPHISINFPYLKNKDSFEPNLNILASGKAQTLETIADFDKIISREFYDELPSVILKMAMSTSAKATAEYFAARAARQAAGDDWAGILVNIAGSIYQTFTNNADLRTWSTLPKQIKIARFPTPSDSVVVIDGRSVKVSPSKTNIIFAKRMSKGGTLLLRSFSF